VPTRPWHLCLVLSKLIDDDDDGVTRQAARRAQAEVEALKLKAQDLERVERLARVDSEQVAKRLEKIRGRALQTALVGVGTKSQPADKLITDDELIALLKKCGDERAEDSTKKTADATKKK